MSSTSFQNSVALLLRCPLPERPQHILKQALGGDLSIDEHKSLSHLADDDEFNKYGREQRSQRWQATAQKLDLLWYLLDEDKIYDIWLHDFEPHYLMLQSDLSSSKAASTREFIHFLQKNAAKLKTKFPSLPGFLEDFLHFVDTQIELAQYVVLSKENPPECKLATPHLRLMRLRYDMISFVEYLEESTHEHSDYVSHITKTDQYIVMVRDIPSKVPRVFEVESALYGELKNMLEGNPFSLTHEMVSDLKSMDLWQ